MKVTRFVLSFANILSHSKSCLFLVCFTVQKLVNVIKIHLFIFVFISTALGDWPKKTLVRFMSKNTLPMIPSSSFMVSYIYVCKSFWIYFCAWCDGIFQFIDRWMDKEDVVHTCNGILLSHKKNKIMSFVETWMQLSY